MRTGGSGGSLSMYASSAGETLGCTCGARYRGHQNTTQIKPASPVAMKAACHPYAAYRIGTSAGETTAPTLVPALKIPVANARSFFGNHSATVLTAAGKFPASPMPKAKRAAANPHTLLAKAWAAAANDHTTKE